MRHDEIRTEVQAGSIGPDTFHERKATVLKEFTLHMKVHRLVQYASETKEHLAEANKDIEVLHDDLDEARDARNSWKQYLEFEQDSLAEAQKELHNFCANIGGNKETSHAAAAADVAKGAGKTLADNGGKEKSLMLALAKEDKDKKDEDQTGKKRDGGDEPDGVEGSATSKASKTN